MADVDCEITEAPETPSEEPQLTDINPAPSTNLEAGNLDDETKEKLKGDMIGDTMYNQSFVIKKLMQLNNIEEVACMWNDELESDLCFLWDMTIEEDVCAFMFELNFPSIATAILQTHIADASLNHRLIELIIGILGNICTPKSSPQLSDDQLKIVLHHIDTDDHLILVQVMRFIKVTSYKTTDLTFITSEIIEKVIYILYNSINVALLEATLDVVVKLTTGKKLDVNLLHENLLEAAFTAFKMIYESENDSDSKAYRTDVVKRNLNHLLQIVVNLAVYCNELEECEQTVQIRSKVCEHSNVIFEELLEIFKTYAEDEYDLSEEVDFLFQSVDFIFAVFSLEHHPLTIVILQLATSVKNACSEEVFKTYLTLVHSLLNKASVDQLSEQINCGDYDKRRLIDGLETLKNTNDDEAFTEIISQLITVCNSE